MTTLKKGFLGVTLAAILLGAFLPYASAAGPVGVPPTQNVSPVFSDVTVQGKVITNRSGYPDLANTKFGAYIKGTKGAAFVTKMINTVFSAYKPILLEDALIVSGPLYGLSAHFFGNLQVEGGLDVIGDTNLNTVFADELQVKDIYSFGDKTNPQDTEPVKIMDKDGVEITANAEISKDLQVTGKSTLVDDITVGLKDDAKEDLLKIRAKDAWNLFNPKIESTGALDIVSNNALGLDSGGDLNVDVGGTLDISATHLNIDTFFDTIFTHFVTFNSEVKMKGHLRVNSIGDFHFIQGSLPSYKTQAWNTLSVSCPANEIMVDCVGYNMNGQVDARIVKPIYQTVSPIKYYCDMYWYNTSATNTSSKLARVQAMCWNTDGP